MWVRVLQGVLNRVRPEKQIIDTLAIVFLVVIPLICFFISWNALVVYAMVFLVVFWLLLFIVFFA